MLEKHYQAGQNAAFKKIAKDSPHMGEHWADYAGLSLLGGGLGAAHSGGRGALVGAAAGPASLGVLKLLEQIKKRNLERRGDKSDYRLFKSEKR